MKKIALIIFVALFTLNGIFAVDYQGQVSEIKETGKSSASDGDLRQGAQEAMSNGDYSEGNILLDYLESKYSHGGEGDVLGGIIGYLHEYKARAESILTFVAELRAKYPQANTKDLQNNKTAQEKVKQDTKNLTKTKQDEFNAEKVGDPVFVPTGEYVQNETDLKLGKNFLLQRNYMSGNNDSGVFGKGWTSSVDEHLVFGIEPLYKEREKSYLKTISDFKYVISEIEDDLEDNLKVPLDYSAEKVIKERYDKIYELYKEKDDVDEALKALDEANAEVSDRKEIEERHRLVKKQYTVYNSLKSQIRGKIDTLYGYRDKLQKLKNEYEDYKPIIAECERIETLNAKVLALYGNKYRFAGLGKITFVDGNSVPHLFTKITNELYFPVDNANKEFEKIIIKNDGNYVIYKKDGSRKIFTENGLFYRGEDRNGNYIEFVRDDNKDIKEISTSDCERYFVKTENEYVVEIKNHRDESEKISFSYENNSLVSVTDEYGVVTRLAYNGEDKLSCITKADGSTVKFIYGVKDFSGEFLTTETINEEGVSESFEYYLSEKKTIYTDHSGKRTVIRYDDAYRTVEKNTPDGSNQTFFYDENGNCEKTVLNGMVTEYRYDGNGNIIESIYEDGSREVCSYDKYNLLTSFLSRDGILTEYERDEKGNLIKLSKGGIVVSEMKYDDYGRVVERSEFSGTENLVRYEYDEFGNTTRIVAGKRELCFEYDNRNRITKASAGGKIIKTVSYYGNVSAESFFSGLLTETEINERKDIVRVSKKDTSTGEKRESFYEYDRRHLPIRLWISDGKNKALLSGRTYLPEGEISSEAVFGESETWLTFYEYENSSLSAVIKRKSNRNLSKEFFTLSRIDLESLSDEISVEQQTTEILSGNKKKIIYSDSLSNITEYNFNGDGYLTSVLNPLGEEFKTVFSSDGNLLSEQNYFSGVYSYNYDSAGNLSSFGKIGKKQNEIEYYPSGKIRKEKFPNDEIVEYVYNEEEMIEQVKQRGKIIYFFYDEFNRPVLILRGGSGDVENAESFVRIAYSTDGRKISYSYSDEIYETKIQNVFDEIVQTIDGEGNTKLYSYDMFGNRKESIDSYGRSTNYKHNAYGLVTEATFPDSSVVKYEYDGKLNLVQITDEEGIYWRGKYDSAGRLINERNRPGIEKDYTYDAIGRLTGVYSNGKKLGEYSYGLFGRNKFFTDANGNLYKYFYDDFGNLESESNRLSLTQKYKYDDSGNPSEKIDFAGNKILFRNTEFERLIAYPNGDFSRLKKDDAGNILSAESKNEKLTYTYTKAGLLKSIADSVSHESVIYSYDKAGRRIRMTGAGRDVAYSYGKNGEIISQKDFETGMSVSFSYDSFGREIARTFGNGNVHKTFYDRAGRIVLVADYNSFGVLLLGEGYVYDNDGRMSGSVNHKGQVTLYSYDSMGRLLEVLYPATESLLEIQRKEADENGLFYRDDSESPVTRWLTSKEAADFSALLFRMRRELENSLSIFQLFRYEKFTYDGNGNCLTKTTPFGTIYYSVDAENRIISSGGNNSSFVNYYYDANGNLIQRESVLKDENFIYNNSNRMTGYKITSKNYVKIFEKYFTYDAFGRRVMEIDSDGNANRILYDSFSLEELKNAPVFSNGTFIDYFSSGVATSPSIVSNERYVFISDEPSSDRYEFTDKSNLVSGRHGAIRFPFYAAGSFVAEKRNDSILYFGNDMRSSIRSESNLYGEITKEICYDVFGNQLENSPAEKGFIGKAYDRDSGLYNFGFRDYSPSLGRFTTEDPIRDGTNWFTYCAGDPVNFVDLWGMELVLTVDKETQTMTVKLNVKGTQFEGKFFVTTGVVSQDPSKPSNPDKTNANGSAWTQFPNGTWNLTGTGQATQPSDERQVYFGETWITTDAHQKLSDGNGGSVDDGGYYIHVTTCSNTAGCIGLQYSDNGESNMNLLLRLYNYNEAMDPGSGKIVVKGDPSKINVEANKNRNQHKQSAWSYNDWKSQKENKKLKADEYVKETDELAGMLDGLKNK